MYSHERSSTVGVQYPQQAVLLHPMWEWCVYTSQWLELMSTRPTGIVTNCRVLVPLHHVHLGAAAVLVAVHPV